MAANRVIPTLILVFMLAACTTSTPSRFYVLTPGVAGGEGPPIGNLVVGVGPVRLAAYLERPQLVVRERTNRLNVQEFDRWGGNLEANISWVIAENLSRSLGTESVVTFPWERPVRADFQVAIDIREFESAGSGEVLLTALWRLVGADGETLHAIRRTSISEPVPGDGFEGQVAAQSNALTRMSREIAEAIRAVRGAPR